MGRIGTYYIIITYNVIIRDHLITILLLFCILLPSSLFFLCSFFPAILLWIDVFLQWYALMPCLYHLCIYLSYPLQYVFSYLCASPRSYISNLKSLALVKVLLCTDILTDASNGSRSARNSHPAILHSSLNFCLFIVMLKLVQ